MGREVDALITFEDVDLITPKGWRLVTIVNEETEYRNKSLRHSAYRFTFESAPRLSSVNRYEVTYIYDPTSRLTLIEALKILFETALR